MDPAPTNRSPRVVPTGTQVVVFADIRGTNGALVHPRGAVGVVTRTPAGTEVHYLVRFPDGFEASFVAEQLEVLKIQSRPEGVKP